METSIEVINVGGIDEIESVVEFQFILHMKWFEGRMNFLNLRESGKNTLNNQEMELLWIPGHIKVANEICLVEPRH